MEEMKKKKKSEGQTDIKIMKEKVHNSHSGHLVVAELLSSRWCSARFSTALSEPASAPSSHKSWRTASNCKESVCQSNGWKTLALRQREERLRVMASSKHQERRAPVIRRIKAAASRFNLAIVQTGSPEEGFFFFFSYISLRGFPLILHWPRCCFDKLFREIPRREE